MAVKTTWESAKGCGYTASRNKSSSRLTQWARYALRLVVTERFERWKLGLGVAPRLSVMSPRRRVEDLPETDVLVAVTVSNRSAPSSEDRD